MAEVYSRTDVTFAKIGDVSAEDAVRELGVTKTSRVCVKLSLSEAARVFKGESGVYWSSRTLDDAQRVLQEVKRG